MIHIGVTCKVCHKRAFSATPFFQVCGDCRNIKSDCPICKNEMPKYKKRGQIRKYCSDRCRKLANPTTSEQATKSQITRFKNHVYKSHQNDIARSKNEYKEWRKAVYERDNYTCQDCGANNYKGNGVTVELHPHHIQPFATFTELRYEVSNGITLCKSCHRKHHNHVFIGRTKRATTQS